jgi:hypothetical protein
MPRMNLNPLPYHQRMADYLRSEEPELWKWFSSAQSKAQYTDSLRLALLKTTYRLDAEGHPALAQAATEAREALELDLPLTLYQAQQASQANAVLYFIPGEAHVVLCGPLLAMLSPDELKSVIGHELAHYLLWRLNDGEFLIVDRLLQAMAEDPRAEFSHQQSARRYQLYTEIFADRGSLAVTSDLNSVVAGLVKTETGLHEVSGASYLRQAEEIFASSKVKAEGLSHPEMFVRARALRLWSEAAPNLEAGVSAMIEGAATVEELDLLGQARSTELIRRFLGQVLQPKWFQTENVLAHARLFFPDFIAAQNGDPELIGALTSDDPKLHELLGYILLDFVVADSELEDLPLVTAWEWSRKLGFDAAFEKLLIKELKLKARDLKRLKQEAAQKVAEAEVAK